MGRLAAWALLGRPTNLALAAVGVLVGGVGTHGAAADGAALVLAGLAALLGVWGGNAINDALDARIDALAHPTRPIPQGHVASRQALGAGAIAVALGVGVSAFTNLLGFLLAAQLALVVAAYEGGLKKRGLLGNLLISYNVGSLFVLGALASALPPLTWSTARASEIVSAPWLAIPLTMGLLAFVLNLGREIYKDAEDAGTDVLERRTFAVARGVAHARLLAGLVVLLVIPLSVAPYWAGVFETPHLLLLAPVLLLATSAAFARTPARSQRLVKAAMVVGFVPLLAVGLI